MTSSALAVVLALTAAAQHAPTLSAGRISKEDVQEQQEAFRQLWDGDLILTMEDLPKEGKVPDYRVPYSGHDYPDKVGGTLAAMATYDRAFYRGHSRAYQHEREDLDFHRSVKSEGPEIVHRGLFGRVISVYRPSVVPVWYGHCNGWTAAAIRHAEPQKSVTRNGIVFTPAAIKGLLAELYMYSQTQSLGDTGDVLNPALLHISLSNWLGRKSHPVAMETSVGEPVINFPIYAYKSTVTRLSPNRYDVRTLLTYTLHTAREYDKGPKANRNLYFHYVLDTDAKGEIVAGYFQRDSAQIDMLWVPLKPMQGGEDGNRGGNPHLKLDEVLSLWRESVEPETLKKWVNIDPTDAERALVKSELPPAPKSDNQDKPKTEAPAAAPSVNEATGTTPAPATPTGEAGTATPVNSDPPPRPSATQ